MTEKDHESVFLEKVRQTLDDSAANLDTRIRSRLNQARHHALEKRRHRWLDRWQPNRLQLAGGMMAAFLIFGAIFYFQGRSEPKYYSGIEDVEILATSDNPEFFTELDFYTWLAEEMDNAG